MSKLNPSDQLEFHDPSPLRAALWAKIEGGFTAQTVMECGGVYARYRKKDKTQYSRYVYAFPGFNPPALLGDPPSAWVIADTTGDPISRSEGLDNRVSYTMFAPVPGSVESFLNPYALSRIHEAEIIWKCKGLTDMLSIHSAIPPELKSKHVVITDCQCFFELKEEWIRLLTGKTIYIIHSADVMAHNSAVRWANHLLGKAAEVRVVILSRNLRNNDGFDVRDYLQDHTYSDLVQLAMTRKPLSKPLNSWYPPTISKPPDPPDLFTFAAASKNRPAPLQEDDQPLENNAPEKQNTTQVNGGFVVPTATTGQIKPAVQGAVTTAQLQSLRDLRKTLMAAGLTEDRWRKALKKRGVQKAKELTCADADKLIVKLQAHSVPPAPPEQIPDQHKNRT